MNRNLSEDLSALQLRLKPLERFVEVFAAQLNPPLFYHSGQAHFGFRFAKPDRRHFCLLKSVRAVSALNAAALLAQYGYCQEIAVLIRTSIECTTHIKYVLSDCDDASDKNAELEKYISDYFADFARNAPSDFKRTKLPQGAVHRVIGDELKQSNLEHDFENRFTGVDPAKLFSNVYLTYSNYVHARYPEVMDMYGGDPGHFHLSGMGGTPKDRENLEILDVFVEDVSLALKLISIKLNMQNLVIQDPALKDWYYSS